MNHSASSPCGHKRDLPETLTRSMLTRLVAKEPKRASASTVHLMRRLDLSLVVALTAFVLLFGLAVLGDRIATYEPFYVVLIPAVASESANREILSTNGRGPLDLPRSTSSGPADFSGLSLGTAVRRGKAEVCRTRSLSAQVARCGRIRSPPR